jgi:hypothetical protein
MGTGVVSDVSSCLLSWKEDILTPLCLCRPDILYVLLYRSMQFIMDIAQTLVVIYVREVVLRSLLYLLHPIIP